MCQELLAGERLTRKHLQQRRLAATVTEKAAFVSSLSL